MTPSVVWTECVLHNMDVVPLVCIFVVSREDRLRFKRVDNTFWSLQGSEFLV